MQIEDAGSGRQAEQVIEKPIVNVMPPEMAAEESGQRPADQKTVQKAPESPGRGNDTWSIHEKLTPPVSTGGRAVDKECF